MRTSVIPTLKLGAVPVLGLACLGVTLGFWLKRRIPLLDRLNIPVSIAGGMVFALAILALHDRIANVEADATLRDLLQLIFMTTIGLGARLQVVREGGVQLVRLLAIASVGALLQNLLGIGLAKALGIDPRFGILAGSVSLAGGPATSIAFGGTFEKMGLPGATAVALASATFGITVAGLIGGYVGGWLIRRYRLKPTAEAIPAPAIASPTREAAPQASGTLLSAALVIGLAMGAGYLLSTALERLGLILPGYIGAMIVAALVRNLDDRFGFARISQPDVDAIGRVSLYLFIAMALLTLRLWELSRLALPLVVILAAQVAFCILMCVFLAYRGMGRNYESAVMASGFCGFMLGITVNAVACMGELVDKYGPAPEAFLVVPIVGAFLIDFTNSLVITTLANLLR